MKNEPKKPSKEFTCAPKTESPADQYAKFQLEKMEKRKAWRAAVGAWLASFIYFTAILSACVMILWGIIGIVGKVADWNDASNYDRTQPQSLAQDSANTKEELERQKDDVQSQIIELSNDLECAKFCLKNNMAFNAAVSDDARVELASRVEKLEAKVFPPVEMTNNCFAWTNLFVGTQITNYAIFNKNIIWGTVAMSNTIVWYTNANMTHHHFWK